MGVMAPKPTSGESTRFHLSVYRLVAQHNFRVARHPGVVGDFAKLLTELYVVPRYTSSERRVRMSSRAETKFVTRL